MSHFFSSRNLYILVAWQAFENEPKPDGRNFSYENFKYALGKQGKRELKMEVNRPVCEVCQSQELQYGGDKMNSFPGAQDR